MRLTRSVLIAFALVALTQPSTPSVAAQASGCITSTTPGDHAYTCRGLRVDARIPPNCPATGCGLILQIHGDTGTGLLEDAHTKLRERGAAAGFIVLSPNGSTGIPAWVPKDEERLVGIVHDVMAATTVDPARVHVTGFSRGGFAAWRLVCDHADLFASAAPAGAGNGEGGGERTCFAPGRMPSRKIPLLMLIGRTDEAVGYLSMIAIRDAAIARYGARSMRVVRSDAAYAHTRWTSSDGAAIETFEHSYETLPDGPWGWARGHCFPGSSTDPFARQYAVGCRPPVSFNWGEEVVRFFQAHPRRS